RRLLHRLMNLCVPVVARVNAVVFPERKLIILFKHAEVSHQPVFPILIFVAVADKDEGLCGVCHVLLYHQPFTGGRANDRLKPPSRADPQRAFVTFNLSGCRLIVAQATVCATWTSSFENGAKVAESARAFLETASENRRRI